MGRNAASAVLAISLLTFVASIVVYSNLRSPPVQAISPQQIGVEALQKAERQIPKPKPPAPPAGQVVLERHFVTRNIVLPGRQLPLAIPRQIETPTLQGASADQTATWQAQVAAQQADYEKQLEALAEMIAQQLAQQKVPESNGLSVAISLMGAATSLLVAVAGLVQVLKPQKHAS